MKFYTCYWKGILNFVQNEGNEYQINLDHRAIGH